MTISVKSSLEVREQTDVSNKRDTNSMRSLKIEEQMFKNIRRARSRRYQSTSESEDLHDGASVTSPRSGSKLSVFEDKTHDMLVLLYPTELHLFEWSRVQRCSQPITVTPI